MHKITLDYVKSSIFICCIGIAVGEFIIRKVNDMSASPVKENINESQEKKINMYIVIKSYERMKY